MDFMIELWGRSVHPFYLPCRVNRAVPVLPRLPWSANGIREVLAAVLTSTQHYSGEDRLKNSPCFAHVRNFVLTSREPALGDEIHRYAEQPCAQRGIVCPTKIRWLDISHIDLARQLLK
ncbi:hypothetical protein [Cupriavidus neocaledonicus]|uniref:hypothetical protein n=1 Tax=Cupriavidus neocaledonicus TaxID=1040979 RepID=UPI001F11B080|nr:hypothetical protein [Cupriavidus neocaledonicus]